MISVFTATYNRAKNLKDLYKSLQEQTYKDFEWVIVDDGSTDNTKEVIDGFIKNSDMKIIYKYQKNGGKMRAHNTGVSLVNGEYFFGIDSDDSLTPNALEIVDKYYQKIKDNDEIAGLVFLNRKKGTDEIIGTKFPEDNIVDTYYNIYKKYNVTGDKEFTFKTKIVKEYLFPVAEGEKFVPEAALFNRVCKKYKFLFCNEVAMNVEYLESGYSNNYFKLAKNNPKGQVLYYKELYELEPTLYNVAAYDMYSIFAKNGMVKTIKNHPSKLKSLIMYFPALYKAKTKK